MSLLFNNIQTFLNICWFNFLNICVNLVLFPLSLSRWGNWDIGRWVTCPKSLFFIKEIRPRFKLRLVWLVSNQVSFPHMAWCRPLHSHKASTLWGKGHIWAARILHHRIRFSIMKSNLYGSRSHYLQSRKILSSFQYRFYDLYVQSLICYFIHYFKMNK